MHTMLNKNHIRDFNKPLLGCLTDVAGRFSKYVQFLCPFLLLDTSIYFSSATITILFQFKFKLISSASF